MPLGDKVAVFLDKGEDLVVILGCGVANTTAMDDFEGFKIKLYRRYPFAIDGGREDEGIGLEVVLVGKDTMVHRHAFF